MRFSVLYNCIIKYLNANRETLRGKDTYRFLKIIEEVNVNQIPYYAPLRLYQEMFETIASDSFHINEKNEKILFEIISNNLHNAPRMPILGRNLKFPLKFRTMEVLYRLRHHKSFGGCKKMIRRILLDSLYPGEHIYISKYGLFGLDEERISACAEEVGIFLHYRVRL
ncbi:MAG: hypothetical protein QW303_00055 [Nitrososphaerota archaeon]